MRYLSVLLVPSNCLKEEQHAGPTKGPMENGMGVAEIDGMKGCMGGP